MKSRYVHCTDSQTVGLRCPATSPWFTSTLQGKVGRISAMPHTNHRHDRRRRHRHRPRRRPRRCHRQSSSSSIFSADCSGGGGCGQAAYSTKGASDSVTCGRFSIEHSWRVVDAVGQHCHVLSRGPEGLGGLGGLGGLETENKTKRENKNKENHKPHEEQEQEASGRLCSLD